MTPGGLFLLCAAQNVYYTATRLSVQILGNTWENTWTEALLMLHKMAGSLKCSKGPGRLCGLCIDQTSEFPTSKTRCDMNKYEAHPELYCIEGRGYFLPAAQAGRSISCFSSSSSSLWIIKKDPKEQKEMRTSNNCLLAASATGSIDG